MEQENRERIDAFDVFISTCPPEATAILYLTMWADVDRKLNISRGKKPKNRPVCKNAVT